jgi:hypothetical protein
VVDMATGNSLNPSGIGGSFLQMQYRGVRKQVYVCFTAEWQQTMLRNGIGPASRSYVAGSPLTGSAPWACTRAVTSAMQASRAAGSVPLATSATPPPVWR